MPHPFRWTLAALLALTACGDSNDPPPDPPDPGFISVVVQLHGNGTDLDDFTARAASLGATTIHPSVPVVLSPVPAGPEIVYLEGLAMHCATADSSLAVTVPPGDTAAVLFDVTCLGGLAYSRPSPGGNGVNLSYLDIDGNTIQLTDGDWDDLLAEWSPDGSTILFASNRAGNWDIFTIRSDGTGLTPLTADTADDLSPTWSPDGQTIAYFRGTFNPTPRAAIRLINPNGTGDHELLATDTLVYDEVPVWVNSGTEIAFSCDRFGYLWDLCVVAPDGNGLRMLFRDAQNLRRSPDGQRVALTRAGGLATVWVAELDGTPPIELTPGTMSFQGDWSPDGTRLVLMTYDAVHSQLQVVNRDATGLTPLTDPADDATSGRWSPDGARIAFYSTRGGSLRVWTMKPDGSDAWPLTLTGSTRFLPEPAWNPTVTPGAAAIH